MYVRNVTCRNRETHHAVDPFMVLSVACAHVQTCVRAWCTSRVLREHKCTHLRSWFGATYADSKVLSYVRTRRTRHHIEVCTQFSWLRTYVHAHTRPRKCCSGLRISTCVCHSSFCICVRTYVGTSVACVVDSRSFLGGSCRH